MARIIDAHTGKDVKIGEVYDGNRVVLIDDRFFIAHALVEHVASGKKHWVQLPVRFMHPSFPFQRVIFLPT